jgi:uncharacterized protein YcfL
MGRSFKKWARSAVMAGWVTWAGGCATPTGPAAPATPPLKTPPSSAASSQSAADQRFVITSALEPVIHVVSVRLIHPRGDFLKIQVNVQNKTEAPQRFHYRIEWFDADGVQLQFVGGEFRPWVLLPHEMSSIAATAPTHAAADFEIEFVP